MSVDSCALLVRQGDPDRYLSAQYASRPTHFNNLLAIYAINLVVARAPWASSEQMICEMRLQWWADAIDAIYAGNTPDSHEILPALAQLIHDKNLPRALFEQLIEARRFDIYSQRHKDTAAFDRYINATAGGVMELAGLALGARESELPTIRQFAYASGIASLLRAVPELRARGRCPLPEDINTPISAALLSLKTARKNRKLIAKPLLPVMLGGWRSGAVLAAARADAANIDAGLLIESPFWRRASLTLRNASGRW